MTYTSQDHAELAMAVAAAKAHGRTPKSGSVVVDKYRSGQLPDVGIHGLHVIGELLDRIAELKGMIEDLHEDAAGASI